MTSHKLRVAIIGTARRSAYMYAPIVKGLPDEVELVGIWGRSQDSARALGETLGTPWYTDLEQLMREQNPDIGIVSVSYGANGQVGLMAVEHGLHVLLETPIAHNLSEADAIIQAAQARGLKIEVAEQFHRRPPEAIKLKLIQSGLFGTVYSAFNDFAGHGYHGISVLRSYLGFDARPTHVSGAEGRYMLAAHASRLAGTYGPREESQEHAIIEFESGQLGLVHWTSVGYDSALRWWRSSRFLAERGMGVTVTTGGEPQEWLSLLQPGGEAPRFITLERRWERNDGGALVAMIAHTGDPSQPILRWENPFLRAEPGRTPQWHDDEIAVAGCLMSLVQAVRDGGEPTYGPHQARLDQELTLALYLSARQGRRVALPLDPHTEV